MRLATLGSLGAALATAHTAVNLRRLRIPPTHPPIVAEPVSVLLPVRDEAHRVAACLRSLLAQQRVPRLELLVLDDGSTDATAAVVRREAGADPRLRLLTGAAPPPGWLGKPHACAQLAAAATGSVLVFLDADVVLAPTGIAATVALLRNSGLHLVSPYPRQLADGSAPRLVQPLLQWSWLTFLPLRLAERSPRPSLAAANGQLLAVDAAAYRTAGGHAAVRAEVLDDVALLRAVKRAGGRGGVVDGTAIATCRMYAGWVDLRAGYAKSLWSAGSPAGTAAVLALLGSLYVVPPLAALAAVARRRPRNAVLPAVGYVAGVTGRLLTARRTGGRQFPDPLAHPLSITLLGWLTGLSWRQRQAGTLTWKGRALAVPAARR